MTIDRKELFKDVKRIVLKIGTSSLSSEDGSFNRQLTEDIAAQVAGLREAGKTVIIVSSGAIGIGCGELKMKERPREIPLRQAAAAVGQNILMQEWMAAFNKHDLILSDIDGLYDKNPKKNEDAKLISTIEKITPEIESYGGSPTSMKGVGGMRTKIEAAKITSIAGCHMVIANSAIQDVVMKIMDGEDIGTLFLARDGKYKNRTRWIILSKTSGKLIVDKGAREAVRKKRGLLPSGIIGVDGVFERGDIIEIESEGTVFAKGITDYSSSELNKIKGKHSDMIEKILGVRNYDEVVRKSNIGLF
ncbi:MAG: glutamate 5-kinase [Candidatus Methanoperedens sp.]|nr:glutamate 5-kinase [Candidatus Methanoperedens sp.]